MALAPMLMVLLFLSVERCRTDSIKRYHNGRGVQQIGELLKPPPPPPLSPIVPVPFHGGSGRSQRQNLDLGYHYKPPLSPPPPVPTLSDFNIPAPFYKQYNFNFVPPPQPFTSTPSPTLFQKVSGWLFPSSQQTVNGETQNQALVKKECNPCNLVPWIPVIRYDLGAKSLNYNTIPTYGPPSPTGYLDVENINDFKPQPFRPNQDLSGGTPHAVYGPPNLPYSGNFISVYSSTYGPPVSTYGPPSPTHTVPLPPQSPLTSPYSASSTPFSVPSSSYGVPNAVNSHFNSMHSVSNSANGLSTSSFSISNSAYTSSSSPQQFSPNPLSTTYGAPTPLYEPELLNNQLSQPKDNNILKSPDLALQLPKVTPPTSFKNSYGEPIFNSYISDIPYPVSATAAESTKIKTEVLPNSSNVPVSNVSLANPAPFTSNRGRNIYTLQPVALPNLSISPLPPIFNARPFRPHSSLNNVIAEINSIQNSQNKVKVEKSVPLAEYTHSVEYPTTVIQSPLIDISIGKPTNQTKAYRNIPSAYILNEPRDIISSQASEDHISSTKTVPDASFESTGVDLGNELYDSGTPIEFRHTQLSNHKTEFADLRGVKDEDVDKYRTESNLQNIDSPLLYLKPSAPHKGHGEFIISLSTPPIDNDYEIYDDATTTIAPEISTHITAWEESKLDYNDRLPPPTAAQESVQKPKIVQIIVPYTTNTEKPDSFNYQDNYEDWIYTQEGYQARKVPSNVGYMHTSTMIENDYNPSTTTESTIQTVTNRYESETINTAAILNDLYDVKEPPFDIIKLQHTIDDWTEQEYSEQHKQSQRNRGLEKYAKQIPDDYFTTTLPTTYTPTSNNVEYDYDHEGSSSNQHLITEGKNTTFNTYYKEYNTIERTKSISNSGKLDESKDKILHIYTAASSFRTTTTPAPWGKIYTSISPLTKEKVYVVTSKPWRDNSNASKNWYAVEFESKKTNTNETTPDSLPFKSPRFVKRPSFEPNTDSMNSDLSYRFSRSWYQRINDLENRAGDSNTTWSENFSSNHGSSTNEDLTNTAATDLEKN